MMFDTAQFPKAVNQPLALGRQNVSTVQSFDGLQQGPDFSVNGAAGTVTLLHDVPQAIVRFAFEYPDPPPVDRVPPDFGADAEDMTNYPALRDAVTNLRAYIALASPTAAQSAAALKLTIRVVLAIVRRMV